MKRRGLLYSLAALPAARAWAAPLPETPSGTDLDNPYAGVDWATCEYLHSMSHQHQGQTEASRAVFHGMGYRHFAFSNYYPSAPTYPLPADYAAAHPEVIGAPNAEHHSFTDSGLHGNALGSLLATGYGHSLSAKQCAAAPLHHRFDGLHGPDEARPWLGVYRLDIRLAARPAAAGAAPAARLTVQGARECAFREAFADRGPVVERSLAAGSHTLYLRTTQPQITTVLDYEPAGFEVTQFRLMQGTNRPWRDVFRAALDGEDVDGKRVGGLQYADGGGITLNHPTGSLDDYAAMLDFDPRVLGIEVWNQLTSGFGSSRGFYAEAGQGPLLHFYRLWDEVLRSGRRCWGFFVKDHNTYGRGRNVLLVPPAASRSAPEREADAMRAYRQGAFFGSVAALATNAAGEVAAPYDHSEFRFSRLAVRRDAAGRAVAVEVAVAGQDASRRPNVQIRLVTDQGVAAVADAEQAEFALARDPAGRLEATFVRVEAFAYPDRHLGGQPLTAAQLRGMAVDEISRLHDRMAVRGPAFFGTPSELRAPIPVVDMIFSQPLRRI